MKEISFVNRTQQQISQSFANLQSRYGKRVHYGSIKPLQGQMMINNGYFIVYP